MTEKDRLYDSITASIRAAKRRERWFWVLGATWLGALFVAAILNVYVIRYINERYDANTEAIQTNLSALSGVRADLENLRASMHTQRDSLTRLENSLIELLSLEDEDSYLLSVADAVVARNPLTNQELALLDQRADSNADTSAENLYLRGVAQLEQGQYGDAYLSFVASINSEPSNPDAYTALGRLYSISEQYEQAVEQFTYALNIVEDEATDVILAARCFALVQVGRLEEAFTDCNEAIRQNPTYYLAYHYRGFANYVNNDFNMAMNDWTIAGDLRSVSRHSLENIGLVYLRQSEWQAAVQLANNVNLIDENGEWNWLFLWIALDKLGETDAAERARTRLVGMQPNLESVKKYLDDELVSGYIDRIGSDFPRPTPLPLDGR